MKLYIPEIKDSFILKKDWTFELYAESRNVTLGMFFNHWMYNHNYTTQWISKDDLLPFRKPDWTNPPTYHSHTGVFFSNHKKMQERYEKEWEVYKRTNPEFIKWHEDLKVHKSKAEQVIKPSITVTIPKGCELTVDRIYIRKGASDFSSLSFYVKGLGELDCSQLMIDDILYKPKGKTKISAFRFWAKLEDVNKIEY